MGRTPCWAAEGAPMFFPFGWCCLAVLGNSFRSLKAKATVRSHEVASAAAAGSYLQKFRRDNFGFLVVLQVSTDFKGANFP